MRKTFIMLASALALVAGLASCDKDPKPEQETTPEPLTVTASIEGMTKAEVAAEDNKLAITWKEGDAVWGFYQAEGKDVTVKYKVTSANGSKATLAKDESWGAFDEPATGTVVYMAFTNDDAKPSGTSMGKDYSKQDGTLDSALKNAAVMVATSSVVGSKLDLKFSNCMSVVAIAPVTLPHNAAPKTIVVSSPDLPRQALIGIDNGRMIFSSAIMTDDIKTITADYQKEGPTYIAVPAASASNITVEALAEDGTAYPVIESFNQNFTANAIHNWDTNPVTIKAFFSVSETQKVTFAKGNLYYDGQTWRFEKNQYDSRSASGCANDIAIIDGEETTTPDGHFGMMFWTYLSNYGATLNYEKINPATVDDTVNWGTASFEIADADGKEWYTMSSSETVYLLDGRPDADKLRAVATVTTDKGVKIAGLLIFPDGYESVPAGLETADILNSSYDQKIFTYEEWKYLEEEGVVFLPATGTLSSKFSVSNFGCSLGYWTSTSADRNSSAFMIGVDKTDKTNKYNAKLGGSRSSGHSVRLVSKCE